MEYVLAENSKSITSLDDTQILKFDIQSRAGVTATSMDVYQKSEEDDFKKISDVAILGKEATFSSSVFDVKDLKVDNSIELQARLTTSTGQIVKRNFSLSVTKPIAMVKETSKIVYGTSVTDTPLVSVKTNTAKIDSYKLYWKKNKEGTYV